MIDIDQARAHAKEYAAALGMAQSGQSLVINALCDEIARLRARNAEHEERYDALEAKEKIL